MFDLQWHGLPARSDVSHGMGATAAAHGALQHYAIARKARQAHDALWQRSLSATYDDQRQPRCRDETRSAVGDLQR